MNTQNKTSLGVGQIALTFHTAAAAVAILLLRNLGHEVEIHEAPHEQMYELLGQGKIDLLIAGWLPASHGKYIAGYEDEIERLAIIYHPYCIWGVPDYVPTDAVSSVVDLLKPEVAARMNKKIQGIAPGAGISRFSRQMIEDYDLVREGYHFENGTLEDCTRAFTDAVKSNTWAVIPLWHPQFLHYSHSIRELDEPKCLLGGRDDATILLRKEIKNRLSTEGLNLLQNMFLGNDVVAELDHAIAVEGISPESAAEQWIKANQSKVAQWKQAPENIHKGDQA